MIHSECICICICICNCIQCVYLYLYLFTVCVFVIVYSVCICICIQCVYLHLYTVCVCVCVSSLSLSLSPCRLSAEHPWTPGASHATAVPHSQSHAARRAAHMAPSGQSQLPRRPLHHGVPPGGEVGGAGGPDPRHRDRAHRPRPHSGEGVGGVTYMQSVLHTQGVILCTPPQQTDKPPNCRMLTEVGRRWLNVLTVKILQSS